MRYLLSLVLIICTSCATKQNESVPKANNINPNLIHSLLQAEFAIFNNQLDEANQIYTTLIEQDASFVQRLNFIKLKQKIEDIETTKRN